MTEILVLYYSQGGAVKEMAQLLRVVLRALTGAKARIRTVPKVSANCEATEAGYPHNGDPYVELSDLEECAGIALGQPYPLWQYGRADEIFFRWYGWFVVKRHAYRQACCVFTSSGSMHGGNESTLLTMMLPLMHHGMLMVGLPYSEPELSSTQSGGTPYGASHIGGAMDDKKITDDEKKLCIALGKRLAETALKLSA